jgi:ABC-type nitrate/sulfonate/bicarbonate transport system ATPase subunit
MTDRRPSVSDRPGQVRLEDVARGFDSPTGRREALAGIDLELAAGEIVSLVGPNGSGKSTLLRVVAGLLAPDRGTVEIDGRRVTGPSPTVGIVFQEPRLLAWRDVESNVAFPLELAGVSPRRRLARARELIDLVGLTGFEQARPVELSGGLRQRTAIARALAPQPSVMLMDEPFSALDALTRERFDREIRDLAARAGATVLLVTHSIPEAVLVGDRVVILTPRPGRIVAVVRVPRPSGGVSPEDAAFGSAASLIRRHLEAPDEEAA